MYIQMDRKNKDWQIWINRQIYRLRIVFVLWNEIQDNAKTINYYIKSVLYMLKYVYKADMTEQQINMNKKAMPGTEGIASSLAELSPIS